MGKIKKQIKDFYSKSQILLPSKKPEVIINQKRSKSLDGTIEQKQQIMKDPNIVTAFNENALFEKTSKLFVFRKVFQIY